MADLDTFRRETRAWLDANCPPSMRTPGGEEEAVWGGRGATYANPDSKLWLDRMASRGWTVPRWPVEYGGGGLSGEQDKVLQEELRRINARAPLQSFGIWMLGPVLLEYGNEAQKQEHIPPICRGEIRWCQGYSEPNAGSDLANLQTFAEDKGDHYLVNGQKTWTSGGQWADKCFAIVRTDKSDKHKGISFMLIDMDTPGVEVRPITMISGTSPFCETFFTDVKVPKENLVGEEGQGWTIGKRLLQHERTNISGGGSLARLMGQSLGDIAKKYQPTGADGVVRGAVTDRLWGQEASVIGRYFDRLDPEIGVDLSEEFYVGAAKHQTLVEHRLHRPQAGAGTVTGQRTLILGGVELGRQIEGGGRPALRCRL